MRGPNSLTTTAISTGCDSKVDDKLKQSAENRGPSSVAMMSVFSQFNDTKDIFTEQATRRGLSESSNLRLGIARPNFACFVARAIPLA